VVHPRDNDDSCSWFERKFFYALSFSLLTGVRPTTEVFPLERAADAYEQMMSGKTSFRAVLTTET
jgi:D-arabinose 1-dehydrogenase-like Zn-dependent alcohol dehydrogenase